MFKNLLPENINVFVTTAANDHESSWGTYCPPFGDKVNGKHLHTCLGDLYSINWLEDSDISDLSKESLKQQYIKVKAKTNKSHVLKFGSAYIPKEPVGDFQSTIDQDGSASGIDDDSNIAGDENNLSQESVLDVHDIELVTKFYQYMSSSQSTRSKSAKLLIEAIQQREFADKIFSSIEKRLIDSNPTLVSVSNDDNTCLKTVNVAISLSCGGYSDYSLQYASTIASLCLKGYPTEALVKSVKDSCHAFRWPHVFDTRDSILES